MQFERKLYEQQCSGLGLSIAKRLIELYGGELTIESIPNQETSVGVTLPLYIVQKIKIADGHVSCVEAEFQHRRHD